MVSTTQPQFLRTSPEQQGVSSATILNFVQAVETQIKEIHSFMLLRHGYVIAEGWWSPYAADVPHMMFSVSKSFTSTAVGLAVDEGYFSIDDPVISFFPDEVPTEINEHLAVMQVRHLLTMSTGHGTDTWLRTHPETDWVKHFLAVPVVYQPGTQFVYNTGATFMLSAIIQKTTGLKLVDYLEPRLFTPLGIEQATWQESAQGISLGGIGLKIRTEDIARLGQLYLQNGMWQGQRLLSEAWIAEATAYQIPNGDDPYRRDWSQGYGYQFWRCQHNAYRADGAFGQFGVVMPEQDAVLAITGGYDDMQLLLNLFWEHVLPAMSSEPLPNDPTAQEALAEKLSSLTLPPVQGEVSSLLLSEISGRTYTINHNPLGIETITLNFSETGSNITVRTAAGEERFSCISGQWASGQTRLFDSPWLPGLKRVATSGAWTAAHRFTLIARLYETPFYHTLMFDFEGAALQIEIRVNASFEPIEPVVLTAHAV